MPEMQNEIVVKFLSRAQKTLGFIPGYIENEDLITAINRSYYAAFYAIKALELRDHYDDFAKHSAVISCFRQNYIKTGMLPADLSDLIGMLSEDRTSGDYDVLTSFDRAEADACYNAAKEIVNQITKELNI